MPHHGINVRVRYHDLGMFGTMAGQGLTAEAYRDRVERFVDVL